MADLSATSAEFGTKVSTSPILCAILGDKLLGRSGWDVDSLKKVRFDLFAYLYAIAVSPIDHSVVAGGTGGQLRQLEPGQAGDRSVE